MTLTSVMAATESHSATVSCEAVGTSCLLQIGKDDLEALYKFGLDVIHELPPFSTLSPRDTAQDNVRQTAIFSD